MKDRKSLGDEISTKTIIKNMEIKAVRMNEILWLSIIFFSVSGLVLSALDLLSIYMRSPIINPPTVANLLSISKSMLIISLMVFGVRLLSIYQEMIKLLKEQLPKP